MKQILSIDFNAFQKGNTVSDENALRRSMVFSVMKLYLNKLIYNENQTVAKALNKCIDVLNDYQANNPEYLPATAYKKIELDLKDYSIESFDDFKQRVNKEFLSDATNRVSKNNLLASTESANQIVLNQICDGYRDDVLAKLYKTTNDLWFKKY